MKLFYLILYKGVEIDEYLLSPDFEKFSKEKKLRIISSDAPYYKINYSESDLDLINHTTP